MGLDMYLNGKKYIGYGEENAPKKEAIQKLFPELEGMKDHYGEGLVKYVEIDVGYWRKANHIHKWFVDNVQNGKDECDSHYVSEEAIEKLREACLAVLADNTKAGELLPTESGFFFGSTEYDEYYFQDIEDTVKICDRALELMASRWSIEYQSSW